jgi:hypothetical protein
MEEQSNILLLIVTVVANQILIVYYHRVRLNTHIGGNHELCAILFVRFMKLIDSP